MQISKRILRKLRWRRLAATFALGVACLAAAFVRADYPRPTTAGARSMSVEGTTSWEEESGLDAKEAIDKSPGKCFALLVGVDEYACESEDGKGLPPLRFAASDALALKKTLLEIGFPEEGVFLFVTSRRPSERPEKAKIMRAFSQILASADEDSTIFVFFSGHGFETSDKAAAFCPEDVEVDLSVDPPVVTKETAILIDDIAGRLRDSEARFKMLVVDACRTSAGAKDLDFAKRSFAPPSVEGLAFLQSCKSRQASWEFSDFESEDGRKGQGVFTHFLIEGLSGKNSERADGGVSFMEMCSYVSRKTKNFVKNELQQLQTPYVEFQGEDFNIVKPRTSAVASNVPSAPRSSATSERLYLEGRALYFGLNGVKVDRKRGLELLEEAMNLGSLNAQAEVALARYSERRNSGSVYYEDIVALAQKPANLGNPFAQGTLGDIYSSDGPLKSEAKAEEYYKAAFENMSRLAEAGDALAALFVGNMYVNGEGVEKNVEEGGAWLRKSADSGCAVGMRGLGAYYANGEDYDKANEWFRKAAEAGSADAMTTLGLCYALGKGVEQSWDKANEWFRKAAEAGNTDAMAVLGFNYEKGNGVEQSWDKANEWYRKAAEAGNTVAMNNLGFNYEKGNGVEQSWDKANEWYRKAANAGNTDAMCNLGFNYEKGNGVEQSWEKANEWYRKAAEAGNTVAMYNLGSNYAKGNGVEQSWEKANEWYRKAAEAGNIYAMNNLGLNYEEGNGFTQDYEKANEWYRKAAEAGNIYAMNNLGVNYANGRGVDQSWEKANEWYRKAAEAGNIYAMNNLGVNYANGNGVEQSWEKANEWYLKAVEAGDSDAMFYLGVNYEEGRGVEQSWDKANEWYRKAAEAGNAKAMNNLGVNYVKGNGVERDYAKANEWYQKAAEAGNAKAMYNLGLNYEEGNGFTQDYDKANEWYQKAAEAGYAGAMRNLANNYEQGRGVEKNLEKAKEWRRKAAEAEARE